MSHPSSSSNVESLNSSSEPSGIAESFELTPRNSPSSGRSEAGDADETLDSNEDVVEPISGFASLGVSEWLLPAIEKLGWTSPTEVQAKVLPLLLGDEPRDLVALAQTGTGKTGAFGIPLVERCDSKLRNIQGLVLCPTRELCLQVAKVLEALGRDRRVRVLAVYGGDSYRRQFEGLERGPAIVVATPGRLIDLLDRKALDLSSVRTLVLDEADEMISVGFREAVETILGHFQSGETKSHKTWLFSATMSADVKRMQTRFIRDAETIDARRDVERPKIRQEYMLVFEEQRTEALVRYVLAAEDFYGLIFCRTKAETQQLEDQLKREGFTVESLHGDRSQREREKVMADFKSKRVKIVVATDVAARGIDVSNITHVVNYGLPVELESYVHRIGRTGRAGKEGVACSILSPKQVGLLRRLEQKTGVKLQQFKPPSAESVVARAIGREILGLMRAETTEEFVRWEGAVREALRGGGMTSPAAELVSVLTKVMREKRPALFERQPLRELSEDRPQRPQQRGGGFGRPFQQRGGDRPRGGAGGGSPYAGPGKKRFGPQADRSDRQGPEKAQGRDGGRNSGGYGRPKSKSASGGPRPKSGSRPHSRSHS